MKKNFALVIALAMLVCLLTGCDNSAPQADSADSAPETPAEVPAEPGSVEDTEVRTIRFAFLPYWRRQQHNWRWYSISSHGRTPQLHCFR